MKRRRGSGRHVSGFTLESQITLRSRVSVSEIHSNAHQSASPIDSTTSIKKEKICSPARESAHIRERSESVCVFEGASFST